MSSSKKFGGKKPKVGPRHELKSRSGGRRSPLKETVRAESKDKAGKPNRFVKWWQGSPRWRRVLVILGAVGVGFGIWFGVQWYFASQPTYSLSAIAYPLGSGTVNPNHGDYSEGTQITLRATPSANYQFVSWSGDAAGTSPEVMLEIDSDKSVVANFRITEYSLTAQVSPTEAGQVSPGGGKYSGGSSVTLTATASAGYEFVSWSGDASGTSPEAKVRMDSDKSVVANFRVAEYTLATQVSPAEAGQVSPGGGRYSSGSSVTLTATASAGYEFVSWSGDASGTSPEAKVRMDSDKSVVAYFVPVRQRITYTMESGISGSVVVYTNELEGGDTVEGFAELAGKFYAQDWTFRWTLEIFGPEGRKMYSWYRGHWVERNRREFAFRAPYSGSYKIRVTHNSLYEKYLVIEVEPKGWTLKSP
jgi:hypothetical protein